MSTTISGQDILNGAYERVPSERLEQYRDIVSVREFHFAGFIIGPTQQYDREITKPGTQTFQFQAFGFQTANIGHVYDQHRGMDCFPHVTIQQGTMIGAVIRFGKSVSQPFAAFAAVSILGREKDHAVVARKIILTQILRPRRRCGGGKYLRLQRLFPSLEMCPGVLLMWCHTVACHCGFCLRPSRIAFEFEFYLPQLLLQT